MGIQSASIKDRSVNHSLPMSILIDNNTRLLVQGITGSSGAFSCQWLHGIWIDSDWGDRRDSRGRGCSLDKEHYDKPVAALSPDLQRPQGAEWVTPGLLYPVAKETVDRSLDSSGERRYREFIDYLK